MTTTSTRRGESPPPTLPRRRDCTRIGGGLTKAIESGLSDVNGVFSINEAFIGRNCDDLYCDFKM